MSNIFRYLVEFIGTFFLVFTVGNVIIEPGLGSFAPIVIGAVLIAIIYAGAPYSGAPYNPAIAVGTILMICSPQTFLFCIIK